MRKGLELKKNEISPLERRGGFTLVEVLVVIAIIALLAALSFPVFRAVRVDAYKATGFSNIRQVYIAEEQYVSDNGDKFTPNFTPRVSSTDAHVMESWPVILSSYTGEKGQTDSSLGNYHFQPHSSIFFDPVKSQKSYDFDKDFAICLSDWGLSFNLSRIIGRSKISAFDSRLQEAGFPIVKSSIANPSGTLEMMDCTQGDNIDFVPGQGYVFNYWKSYDNSLPGMLTQSTLEAPYPGGGRAAQNSPVIDLNGYAITIFCDGHVKLLFGKNIWTSDQYWETH